MKKIRIAIPLANGGELHGECSESISRILDASKDKNLPFEVEVVTARSGIIAINRNTMISHSIKKKQVVTGFDYMLTLDSDVAFSVRDVVTLYNNCEEGSRIISGLYCQRRGRLHANAGMWDKCPGMNSKSHSLTMTASGIKIVDWVAGGFCMIEKSVFNETEHPWYENKTVDFPDDDRPIVGEDIGFCLNVAKVNIPILVNCDVKLKHLV